jgi:hypothetical protein
VVSAVVGFGSVAITGVYGAGARHTERSEETSRYFASPGWPELALLAVPVFGAAAAGDRWGGSAFGRVWIVGGLLAWLAAAGLLLWVVRPAERRIREDRATWASSGRRLLWASILSDGLFIGALVLMIAQPA